MRRFVLAAISAALLLAPAGLAATEATAATGATGTTHAVAANWPVVKQGARGERVRAIQLLLRQQGVRGIIVDGTFGKDTTAAVKTFQRAKRLVVDGHVGPASWQKLVVTVRRGSRGDAVRALQGQLRNQYGYRSVVVDGAFGAATQTAVKNFQGRRGLHADGVVGLATWKAIEAG
jgi:peptidoglycan hydrolase-like protein with peptidoglycan-binding domain